MSMVRGWPRTTEQGSITATEGEERSKPGLGSGALEERRMLAAMYTVDSASGMSAGSGTTGSLPYVIGQINTNSDGSGYDVQFSALFNSAQTITPAATLDVTQTVGKIIIQGPGKSKLTVSGGTSRQVWNFADGVSATMTGMTIAHGATSQERGSMSVAARSRS